ncbi:MAG: 4-(cytidine 5'-diphospho)-2-C-methyl-D-erythritol kinase [Bacteroidetes bacterium]|nr:4-(cytidine 5'-diphospho)-2-C-methyl-D-erythritol kinase [Bacteroidota bacterium]
MIAFPNAKINLGLNVLDKRADGFHNIDTVFFPVDLCDVLEIIKTEDSKTSFNSSGLRITGDQEANLCMKAYHLLKDKFSLPDVKIHLHKVIPMGAGLGGGSSDAAFTLKLLNNLFDLKIKESDLLKFASKLGADCAFFIINEPHAAFERGDKFKQMNIDLNTYQFVIIAPDIHVDTAFAYSKIIPKKKERHSSEIVKSERVEEWRYTLVNDFEEPIFGIYPELKNIKSALYNLGATYASMSGSGSAVYGMFEKPIDLSANFKDSFYWSSKI